MPGMDGKVLGMTIRADQQLHGTRLVMMSSAALRGDATRMKDMGFAATVGAKALAAVVQKIENTAKNSDMADLKRLLPVAQQQPKKLAGIL